MGLGKMINKYGFELVLCLLILCSMVPILAVSHPPLQDYPDHLMRAKIIADYDNPELNYDKYYEVDFNVIPNIMFDLVAFGFMLFLPPLIAGKLVLLVYVVLFVLSFSYFLASFGKSRWLSLFGFFFVYNNAFNRGNLSFLFGVCFYLLALGYFFRHKDKFELKHYIVLGLIILLTYFSHLFVFGLLLMSLGLVFLLEIKQDWKTFAFRVLTFVPSMLLLVFYQLNVARASGEFKVMSVLTSFFSKINAVDVPLVSFAPLFERILLLIPMSIFFYLVIRKFLDRFGGSKEKILLGILFSVFVVSWVSGNFWFLVVTLIRFFGFVLSFDELKSVLKYKLLLVVLLLVALYLVIPTKVSILIAPHLRVLFIIILLLFAFANVPRKSKFFSIGVSVMVILFSVQISYFTLTYNSLQPNLSSVMDAFEKIPSGQIIVSKSQFYKGHVCYVCNLYGYYHIFKGGVSPKIFMSEFQPLSYKEQYMPDNQEYEYYDYVLTYRLPSFKAKGYDLNYSNNFVNLYRDADRGKTS